MTEKEEEEEEARQKLVSWCFQPSQPPRVISELSVGRRRWTRRKD